MRTAVRVGASRRGHGPTRSSPRRPPPHPSPRGPAAGLNAPPRPHRDWGEAMRDLPRRRRGGRSAGHIASHCRGGSPGGDGIGRFALGGGTAGRSLLRISASTRSTQDQARPGGLRRPANLGRRRGRAGATGDAPTSGTRSQWVGVLGSVRRGRADLGLVRGPFAHEVRSRASKGRPRASRRRPTADRSRDSTASRRNPKRATCCSSEGGRTIHGPTTARQRRPSRSTTRFALVRGTQRPVDTALRAALKAARPLLVWSRRPKPHADDQAAYPTDAQTRSSASWSAGKTNGARQPSHETEPATQAGHP